MSIMNKIADLLQFDGKLDEAQIPLERRSVLTTLLRFITKLSGVLTAKGDFNAAELLYERFFNIYNALPADKATHSAMLHCNFGWLLHRMRKLVKAEVEYREAVWREPSANNHGNLGLLLHEKGDLEGAEVECRRALEFDSSDDQALGGLAHMKSGNKEEFVTFLKGLLNI